MGKISPVAAKYIIQTNIEIDGVVDRPDVIGAIFGQTEGLLGADLELRELQRSGRIGRIEVNTDTKGGKTAGQIIIPSSLDKSETAIVGAALEIIQRIGPCNAKIRVEKIEDVRVSKRTFIVERAKELLKNLMDTSMPDSQEIADEVAYSVRVMEITEFGAERLPAGPVIADSDEIIIVEGRADVLNLLKHGFKNSIAINGTSIPETIKELCKTKTVTVFVDGDRGGDLIIREFLNAAEFDFVTKAPDGKEVEELTKKEIHKAIRSRIASEQLKLEGPQTVSAKPHYNMSEAGDDRRGPRPQGREGNFRGREDNRRGPQRGERTERSESRPEGRTERAEGAEERPRGPTPRISAEQKAAFKTMLEDLIGTRGASILDDKMVVLGKVPTSELSSTIKSLKSGMHAIVFDGIADRDIVNAAEKAGVSFLVAMDSKFSGPARCKILTIGDL